MKNPFILQFCGISNQISLLCKLWAKAPNGTSITMQTGNLNYDNLCEKFIAVGYPEIFDIKFFDKAERKFVSTTFDKGKNTFEMSVGKDGITTIAVYCDRSPEDYMGK